MYALSCCIADVLEDCSPKDHTILQALRFQPRKVYCSVYADRCEGCSLVNSKLELAFWDNRELKSSATRQSLTDKEFERQNKYSSTMDRLQTFLQTSSHLGYLDPSLGDAAHTLLTVSLSEWRQ